MATSGRLVLIVIAILFAVNGEVHGESVQVIHSYPPNSWTKGIDEGLSKSLSKRSSSVETYHFHSVYWEGKSRDLLEKEVLRVIDQIAKKKPSVVLLVDDEATDAFVGPLSRRGVPILFTGVNTIPDRVPWRAHLAENKVTGVWEAYPVRKALELFKASFPKNKRFSIITSDTFTSKRTIELFERVGAEGFMEKSGFRLRRTYLTNSWQAWKSALKEIEKKDDFYWVLIPFGVKDLDNRDVSPERMIAWMKDNIVVPGVGARSLADGLLLSVGVSATKLGAETGDLLVRVLGGEQLARISPVKSASYELVINPSKLNSKNRVESK